MRKKKRGWIRKDNLSKTDLKDENEKKQEKNQLKEEILSKENIFETDKNIDDIKDEDCLDEFFKSYLNEQKNILGNLKKKTSKYKEYIKKRNPNINKMIEKETNELNESIVKEKNDFNFLIKK